MSRFVPLGREASLLRRVACVPRVLLCCSHNRHLSSGAASAAACPTASNTEVRVRYAPSPTGHLHLGGLRTALFNFLFARRHNGSFLLRIEDTDTSRLVPGARESLQRDLAWAGLVPDDVFVQSERLPVYREHAQMLLDRGHAYRCFCSAERLEELRTKAAKAGGASAAAYDRRCWTLTREQVQQKLDANEPHVVRMLVPRYESTTVNDVVKGQVVFKNTQLDDQVLLKSDGWPTYHLASVVDDHLMGISHVIRGEEWLSSAPKHVLLYKSFGWRPPEFAHIPLLLNTDGSKLSKRQAHTSLQWYKDQGYLPEAVINFVSLLGWTPNDGAQQILTMNDLISQFSLEKVHKGNAIVTLEKLTWLNAQHLRHRSDETLLFDIRDKLVERHGAERISQLGDEYILRVIATLKGRMQLTSDLIERSDYFFQEPKYDATDDSKQLKLKATKPNTAAVLEAAREALERLPPNDTDSPFTADTIAAALKVVASDPKLGIKLNELWLALRYVLTATSVGAEVPKTIATLGRSATLARLQAYLSKRAS